MTTLYGENSCVFNVHTLKHVTETVRESGPLTAHSTFAFESYMKVLKDSVHGSSGVPIQIAEKIMRRSYLLELGRTVLPRPVTLFLLQKLSSKIPPNKSAIRLNKVLIFGKPKQMAERHQRLLCGGQNQAPAGLEYSKIIYSGKVYTSSISHRRSTKRNDSIIQLTSLEFVKIITFAVIHNECKIIVEEFQVNQFRQGEIITTSVFSN